MYRSARDENAPVRLHHQVHIRCANLSEGGYSNVDHTSIRRRTREIVLVRRTGCGSQFVVELHTVANPLRKALA